MDQKLTALKKVVVFLMTLVFCYAIGEEAGVLAGIVLIAVGFFLGIWPTPIPANRETELLHSNLRLLFILLNQVGPLIRARARKGGRLGPNQEENAENLIKQLWAMFVILEDSSFRFSKKRRRLLEELLEELRDLKSSFTDVLRLYYKKDAEVAAEEAEKNLTNLRKLIQTLDATK